MSPIGFREVKVDAPALVRRLRTKAVDTLNSEAGVVGVCIAGAAINLSALLADGLSTVEIAGVGGLLAVGASFAAASSRARRAPILAAQPHFENQNAHLVASLDPLTGLPSRAEFRRHLEAALAHTPRQPVVVLFADLDRFKEVNDGLGHDAGDALLIEVARRFRAGMRGDDMLARLGGDEFAAVLSGADAQSRVDGLLASIIRTIEEPIAIKGDIVSIGVSIGVSGDDADQVSSEELLRRADIAMYRAKADPANSFCRFTHDLDEAVVFKRAMRTDLESAISGNQLRMELQPIYSARTGKVVSAEALMRWRHPVRGELAPGKFIALAEDSGQIIELGDWAIGRALEFARELGDIPVAVNVSPAQFRHEGFAQSVADRILKSGVPSRLLKVEITEGVLIAHTETARRVIRQLRDLGVQVVLDDFGTGFSSLSYLQSFQFDAFKIDRSFVRDLGGQNRSTQLTRAMIDLGHGLGMEVVAEGIENSRQASLLQLLGCDHLQGFFLGIPMDLKTLKTRAEAPPIQIGAGPELVAADPLQASRLAS